MTMFVGPAPHPAGETPAVSPDAFRDAMRELASGVALVTTSNEGLRAGCVVSSFVSLSLTPPTMLVCLNATSSTLRAIETSGVFALNILGAAHEALARRFADPALASHRFAQGDWSALETGAPALSDALAVIDCRLERLVPHATHVMLIGAAMAVTRGPQAPALVHRHSRFGSHA
jgi:flavin reductase (DIM6/NTAB) family NADH-FMN oxidoreductase RutF